MVARQPVFDRERRVFGYQLRFGPADSPGAAGAADAEASAILDSVAACRLDRLTLGRPAFVPVPPEAVRGGIAQAFPPGQIVVEVPVNRQGAAVTRDALLDLRQRGYSVALDDFALSDAAVNLLPLARFVKLDFLATPSRQTTACVAAARQAGASIVASNVEAAEVFEEAAREGFTHFQGFFFERQAPRPEPALAPTQLVSIRLLQLLHDPNSSLNSVEDVVKRDAALSHRVLRIVNSAAMAQTREITSMRQAILLLGRDTIRRWASFAVVAGLGVKAQPELVVMAAVRARFCELLTARTKGDDAAGEAFLMGLCSLLDVILSRPMRVILDELPLSAEARSALLGFENPGRHLLDCVTAYERGDWPNCLQFTSILGIERSALLPAYIDALGWAHELQQSDRKPS